MLCYSITSIFMIHERQIESIVKKILIEKRVHVKYHDCLLKDYIKNHPNEIELMQKIKFCQMKIGEIWQAVFGLVKHFEDLRVGHPSGLDIRSKKLKIIMELKNSYNTDNSSSRKAKFDCLCEYIKQNPKYQPI